MISLKRILLTRKKIARPYDVSICCIIKDENAYLDEWIRYHLLIGVQHFYIYDNQSKVPVAATLQENGLAGYATVHTIKGRSKQVKAYRRCLKKYRKTSRWMAFIDTDEFILPKARGGNLVEFLKDYEAFGGLALNWQIFGSNGHISRTRKPQLESFTMRAVEQFEINKHIKCIIQPRYVKDVANSHSFHFKKGKFCVNENGKQIADTFAPVSVQKIQLNHYYCRSLEEYHEKIARGLGDTRRERKIEEFYHHDCNDVADTGILDLIARLTEEPAGYPISL
jgi:hypothetical protein